MARTGEGGVGQKCQCISNSGIINQRITHWDVPNFLRFLMQDTTLYFRPCVNSIQEEFVLVPIGDTKTQIACTTIIHVTGIASLAKGLIMIMGMKFVHRYVFKNWSRILIK